MSRILTLKTPPTKAVWRWRYDVTGELQTDERQFVDRSATSEIDGQLYYKLIKHQFSKSRLKEAITARLETLSVGFAIASFASKNRRPLGR